MTTRPVLELRGVCKSFGGLRAIAGVSFAVRAGEIAALIGPNGAGKTTTFNVITGLLRPDQGDVLLNGRSIVGLQPHEIAARRVARTFQNLQIFANMSVLDNVLVAAVAAEQRRPWYLARALVRGAFDDAAVRATAVAKLEAVGLAHLANHPAKDLSFGEQRLLEVARALALDPTLLLLDEPASGLSRADIERLAVLLRRLRAEGLAILLIEHDVGTVMRLADRVVVLNHGEKLAEGTPAQVGSDPAVIAAYLGAGARAAAAPSVPRRSPGPPLLVAEGLCCHRGEIQVLRGVSLQVRRGELVAIIGPNGAGKSTLLGSLAGLYPVSRGAIHLCGVPITGEPAERLARRGIHLVPERRGMFGGLTVAENLRLGAYRRTGALGRGGPLRADLDRVYQLFPRLRERRAQPAGTLSGGEQQMLAIGRGLMSRPTVLMLDEPSLGLAPLVAEEIFRTLSRLKDEGTTIVLVEQNTRAAFAVADRVYVLERGEIRLEGDPHSLARDARVAAAYLGVIRTEEEGSMDGLRTVFGS